LRFLFLKGCFVLFLFGNSESASDPVIPGRRRAMLPTRMASADKLYGTIDGDDGEPTVGTLGYVHGWLRRVVAVWHRLVGMPSEPLPAPFHLFRASGDFAETAAVFVPANELQ
jgi:hypothetical protein